MTIVVEILRQIAAGLFNGGPELVAGALALTVLTLLGRLYLNRKRLSFEEDFNSKIGIVPFASQNDPAAEILTVLNSVSVVVIRVWNSGRTTIEEDDYRRALRFVVRERYIVDFRLSEPEPDTLRTRVQQDGLVSAIVTDAGDPPPARHRDALVAALPDSLLRPTPEQQTTSRQLQLPRLQMRPGDEFRLVVSLREDELVPSNSSTDKGYEFGGVLNPGRIIDQDAPKRRFSATRILSTAVVVLVVLLAVALVWRPETPPYCAEGNLRVVGSSAFAPTLQRITERYRQDCAATTFTIAMSGSLAGIQELQEPLPPQGPAGLAFSDGAAADPTDDLQRRPVAVLVYAVVVNKATGVQNLTTSQIQQIHSGVLRNWSELGGNDIPISIISRAASSGTRRTFEERVLGGREMLPVTSNSCQGPADGGAPVRCERDRTEDLLSAVNAVRGGIGYADASPSTLSPDVYPQVQRISIDGHEPIAQPLSAGGYRFWVIEYAYTRLTATDVLPPRFVGYLGTPPAAVLMFDAGYLPCVGSDGRLNALCAAEQ